MVNWWRLAGALLLLGGCAGQPLDPAVIEAASQPVICKAGAECDAKWSRAVSWVVRNSQWKIQNQTDQIVETYNPTDYSTSPGFTITKVAEGNDAYEIDFATSCVNMFGCQPNPVALKADFNEYVNG